MCRAHVLNSSSLSEKACFRVPRMRSLVADDLNFYTGLTTLSAYDFSVVTNPPMRQRCLHTKDISCSKPPQIIGRTIFRTIDLEQWCKTKPEVVANLPHLVS